MIKFESLGNKKFQTLEKEQLNLIVGGQKCSTGAGVKEPPKGKSGGHDIKYSADTKTSYDDGSPSSTQYHTTSDKSSADVSC